ncbi:PAS domain-containing hybrid sensor histidine kinase/response regulator [Polyangium aurulentum]|uniref:PAS domain-containing hybrid sensor histidine kinase/response regulator n=1 Tax=Polyangium aurulentum TaxID=2567896 RepID=UPI0010AEC250|nr:PAS domain S-box protein [Polyangium aurulentum]UQA61904.1 PAS domain S-box protein [Polyangium aurulentum]
MAASLVASLLEPVQADHHRDRPSETSFRNLAYEAPVMLWMTAPDFSCTYLNRQWYEFTGQTEQSGLGLGWLDAVHPDDRAPTGEAFRRANELHEAIRVEYRLRRRDGTYRWCIDAASPRFGPRREFLGYIGSVIDITERKEAEILLGESEKRFRRAVMVSPIPIIIHAEDGEIVLINPAWTALSGYSLAQIPTIAEWAELAYGAARKDMVRAGIDALYDLEGSTNEGEFTITTASGAQRIWEFSSAALGRDALGRRLVISLAHDVTERKRAEMALKEADQRKDEFMAMLAHELRNPLGPVRNAVRILQQLGPQQAPFSKACAMIDRQVGHMARLIDDLLDVSRITRGKIELRKERCDLTRVVMQTAEDYRETLIRSGLSLELSAPAEPLWVEGDATRLAQVVGNVLHNANKFTETGGRVTVSLSSRSNGTAVLRIRDTGIGMEPTMLARAFEPFTQADRSLDRSRGGLGMGLALVKGLVELHGGTVAAESAGIGRGTEIVIELPEDQPRNSFVEPPLVFRRTPEALRILIIEDNQDAAESLALLLSLSGHEVESAAAGTAGVQLAGTFAPQVVLCDIGLPGGMDGYGVARALRQEEALQQPFLIALTGYGQEEDQRRAREAGFDVHLVKPVDIATLQEVLSSVAARGSDAAE